MINVRKGKFSLDGADPVFPGYTAGQTWNGWACPYFDYETALKVAEASCGKHVESEDQFDKNVKDTEWMFSKEKDAFLINCDQYDEIDSITGQDVICGAGTIGEEKIHVYALGNGCWIWDEEVGDLPCHLIRIDFTPDPGESIYDYPFKEQKASKEEQITEARSDIKVVRLNDYETIQDTLPAYSGRRGARYQIKMLAENLTEDQILHLIGSCQECLNW